MLPRLLFLLLMLTTSCGSTPNPEATSPDEALRAAAAQAGLPTGLLETALDAWRCADDEGEIQRARGRRLLTVIDYSRRSSQERLWVLDLEAGEVLFTQLVAHGKGTGGDRARSFSNVEGSKQSSLGLFRTAETYRGKHGYSLRLDGLEPGINDAARDRAIVIHGADYATEAFVAEHGRLGRSWGCPALDPAVSAEVVDTIKGGTLVFAWHPEQQWQQQSRFLECD